MQTISDDSGPEESKDQSVELNAVSGPGIEASHSSDSQSSTPADSIMRAERRRALIEKYQIRVLGPTQVHVILPEGVTRLDFLREADQFAGVFKNWDDADLLTKWEADDKSEFTSQLTGPYTIVADVRVTDSDLLDRRQKEERGWLNLDVEDIAVAYAALAIVGEKVYSMNRPRDDAILARNGFLTYSTDGYMLDDPDFNKEVIEYCLSDGVYMGASCSLIEHLKDRLPDDECRHIRQSFSEKYGVKILADSQVQLTLPPDTTRLDLIEEAQQIVRTLRNHDAVAPSSYGRLSTAQGVEAFGMQLAEPRTIIVDLAVKGSQDLYRREMKKSGWLNAPLEDVFVAELAYFIVTGQSGLKGVMTHADRGVIRTTTNGLSIENWYGNKLLDLDLEPYFGGDIGQWASATVSRPK